MAAFRRAPGHRTPYEGATCSHKDSDRAQAFMPDRTVSVLRAWTPPATPL
jgi:hypothetical protein